MLDHRLVAVLEGLYSIDGITYWVGDPMTPPGTVSGMFPLPGGSAAVGWSSDGAVPNLYLPTQGDLYLIQQAFLPETASVEAGDDPDRAEAVREIQRLLDGGGLRPLGPASATHMPPVLLNVDPGVVSSASDFTFTPEA